MKRTVEYPVVGVTFEGRQEILERFYGKYAHGRRYGARLLKEDGNQYDANAVAVELETSPGVYEQVGYISRQHNEQVRRDWDSLDGACLRSIGYGGKGQLGLAISVTYGKEKDGNG